MGDVSAIEWTDRTWNPWHGCHKVSQGCKNCYMFTEKKRYGQNPDVVVRSKTTFKAPLKWPNEPAMCFTCSWSDWFIEEADPWRDEAYEIIRATPWITYQILTKRIERAKGRFPADLPNVWLGVSVEDQKSTDARIPLLLRTRAAMLFVSYEPALGPVDFREYLKSECPQKRIAAKDYCECRYECEDHRDYTSLDWVIVGGESGPNARPIHPDWARSVRDQCEGAGVAFFFKQWGGTNKKAAGAVLDGREWRQFPMPVRSTV